MHLVTQLWSPLSNKLSGIVFSNIASGDSKFPNQQTIKCGEDKLLYDDNKRVKKNY